MTKHLAGLGYAMRRICCYPLCYMGLRRFGESTSFEDAVDLTFSSPGGFIRPLQNRSEILRLLALLRGTGPECIVEIGTASGGTLFLLTRAAAPGATLISIDLPGGSFGGGYKEWRAPLYRSFARRGQALHLIRGDSHAPDTVRHLGTILAGREIDFLFIDGDHTYEGVRRDFELYRGFMRDGGLIGFHDIVEHTSESGCDVHRFWRELRDGYESMEFVENWTQQFGGIGVIRWKCDGISRS
jgi:predicted O-methyltransferase YrrM